MSLIDKQLLTDADYAMLARSCISREMAEAAGLFRVDTHEGARMFARKADVWHTYSGIVFPYFTPDQPDTVRDYRLRRDKPDEKREPDGEIKEYAKYLSPPGAKSMLYFAPGTDPAWLLDETLPLLIVEGEKKCLAMMMLARLKADKGRLPFLPVAIPGVWNFKRSDIVVDEDGTLKKVSNWISDLNRIVWQGRATLILFDSNIYSNENVKAARYSLAYLLRGWQSQVKFVNLPCSTEINGPDDHMNEYGPDAMMKLINEAFDGLYPECFNAGEHYALRDWAKLDDVASLVMARWGWDAEDKETFKAINCTWGGRKTKIFRLRQIDVYKRLKQLPDDATVSDRKIAEKFARERVKKLLATVERTLSIPLVELLERGGQVNPKTEKRLPAKYRIMHKPFLDAKRKAEAIYADGEYEDEKIFNPARAREIAARLIADRFLIENASVKIRDERKAKLERREKIKREAQDARALQVSFEKWIQKKGAEVWEKMFNEGMSRVEIMFYFRDLSEKVAKIGRKNLDKKRFSGSQVKQDDNLQPVCQNSMATVHGSHNSSGESDADSLSHDSSLVSPPLTKELGNNRESSHFDSAEPREVLPGPAMWHNADCTQPVTVKSDAGIGADGRHYVWIEESETGIPFDEIYYPPPEPEKLELTDEMIEAAYEAQAETLREALSEIESSLPDDFEHTAVRF